MSESREDLKRRYLEATEEGYAKGFVKIHITLDPDEDLVGGETVWARQWETPDTFIVENITFFASWVNFGDIVRCKIDDQGHLEVAEVVTKSDWQPFKFIASLEYEGKAIDDLGIKSSLTQVERAHGTIFSGVTQEPDRLLEQLRNLLAEHRLSGFQHPAGSDFIEDEE